MRLAENMSPAPKGRDMPAFLALLLTITPMVDLMHTKDGLRLLSIPLFMLVQRNIRN